MLDWLKWFLFDASVLDPTRRYWIGFLVSLACFVIASYFAKQVKDSPRLFTVVALFAGAWVANASGYQARLLLFGKGDDVAFILADLTSDLAGFIMVFAGAVLARNGREEHWFMNSQRHQVLALSLFAAVVIPRQYSDWIAPRIVGLAVSGALTLAGYLALALGARAVANSRHFASLVVILAVYVVLELGRQLQVMIVEPRPNMSDFFMFGFATSKLLLTFTFGYIVLWHHRFGHAQSGQVGSAAAPVTAAQVQHDRLPGLLWLNRGAREQFAERFAEEYSRTTIGGVMKRAEQRLRTLAT